MLDSKDDLVGADCGGHGDLDDKLDAVLGTRLFTRDDYDAAGAWPDVTDMTSRILCVISGNGNTRASYRWAYGAQPALAVNARGDVVLVYRATAGDLHCFVGAIGPTGAIAWQTKTVYCYSRLPLLEPVVSVNDDGWIVAVHRFVPPEGYVGGTRLESIVGRIGADRRTQWRGTAILGIGGAPRLTLRGTDLVEWHVEDGRTAAGEGCARHAERPGEVGRAAAHRRRAAACRHRGLRRVHVPLRDRRGGGDPVRAAGRRSRPCASGSSRSSRSRRATTAARSGTRSSSPPTRRTGRRSPPRRRAGRSCARGAVESVDVPCPAQIAATDDPRAAWYQDYTSSTAALA